VYTHSITPVTSLKPLAHPIHLTSFQHMKIFPPNHLINCTFSSGAATDAQRFGHGDQFAPARHVNVKKTTFLYNSQSKPCCASEIHGISIWRKEDFPEVLLNFSCTGKRKMGIMPVLFILMLSVAAHISLFLSPQLSRELQLL
jgi:hypothetical protein